MSRPERGFWLDDAGHRADLATFVDRARRLDEAAVIRLRARRDGLVGVWVATGFDVLATRAVPGRVRPDDLCTGADALAAGLAAAGADGYVDPGFAMDAAWRGALPPETGFTHLDDVPARVVLELAQRGAELAREHAGAHGPPASLLDQEVISVSSGEVDAGIPMRAVFALTAMGFLPQQADAVAASEVVRVRVTPAWLRIDARFGSVYRRRGGPSLLVR
ncbi:hypothetical protein C731_3037 [Mycolicibacterium hassiacum DSM 44199]|mgnify:CR=1 FL=1|jgi:hypothetical protein|uniref:Uncharacterized protein n=1 Tax=Mycolicibacterium hassiacum (strain DSM 44199 / CIP 105218 / JCM 12690 / 3849) TaxID=1122247 RepID=K5BAW3_MYCHD|nr:hypothetical protein [Mycolicibacterium hassiacum]EKF22940.1 hypothetical protein C731_3037 [Mycolicibacterium hassiacum DSM 44199]MBX5486493.1 hypothetical protein [Mycolicibacterium hassiacum]MDA4087252.1 hypothetical protein [Mycolicibacterium hassiacum DSM 44199]PZN12452.1 MAG: hypothetical protein DIU75_23580 [Mycolicibacterium hassiacum]VCT89435.1 hypothetical protein MHAS_01128 [Mycolicibacterium hassiacum DSM 44199]